MLKILSLLTLLSISSLNCAHKVVLPIKADEERCGVFLGKTLEESYCRCQMYHIGPDFVGPNGEGINHPIKYCDRQVGFSTDAWVRYVLWWQQSFEIIHDQQKSFKAPEVRELLLQCRDQLVLDGFGPCRELLPEQNSSPQLN